MSQQDFTQISLPPKKRLVVQVYELPIEEETYCQHLQPGVKEAKLCHVRQGQIGRDIDEEGNPTGPPFEFDKFDIVTCPCCNRPVCDVRHLSDCTRTPDVKPSSAITEKNEYLCLDCAELPLLLIDQIIAFRKSLE